MSWVAIAVDTLEDGTLTLCAYGPYDAKRSAVREAQSLMRDGLDNPAYYQRVVRVEELILR